MRVYSEPSKACPAIDRLLASICIGKPSTACPAKDILGKITLLIRGCKITQLILG